MSAPPEQGPCALVVHLRRLWPRWCCDEQLRCRMAIEETDIRVGATYETAGRQLRKVLRLMGPHVIYEVRTPSPPFYRISVLKRKFAAEAMREHSGAD